MIREDMAPAKQGHTDEQKVEILRRAEAAGLILDGPVDPKFVQKAIKAAAGSTPKAVFRSTRGSTREDFRAFLRNHQDG